ncbi:MAG: hypothetical protein ACJ71Y_10210 [Blastococcus sp.]
MTALEQSAAHRAETTVAAARSAYESARTLLVVVLVVGMLAAVALGLFVAGLVIQPVIAVRNGLVAMAAGDLTAHVDVTSTDEVGVRWPTPCFPGPRAHSGRAGGPRRSRSTHDRPARRTTRSNR